MHTFFSILRTSDHSHANHSPPKRVPPGSPDRASVRWSWSNLKHNRIRGIRATVLINPRLNGVSIKVSGLTFYRRPRSGKPTPRSRAVERRGGGGQRGTILGGNLRRNEKASISGIDRRLARCPHGFREIIAVRFQRPDPPALEPSSFHRVFSQVLRFFSDRSCNKI